MRHAFHGWGQSTGVSITTGAFRKLGGKWKMVNGGCAHVLIWAIVVFALAAKTAEAQLAVYEFTGSPAADNQFNQVTAQPDNGQFGLFLRSNVSFASGQNVFNSKSWNTTGVLDQNQYVGFTLSANSGFGLDLTQVSFRSQRSSTGPADAQVSLFLNNSSSAAESFTFHPSSTSLSSSTFDFADVSGVSSAEFRFYGMTSSSAAGTLRFDDVATSGTITPVPEPQEYGLISGLALCAWAWVKKCRGLKCYPSE